MLAHWLHGGRPDLARRGGAIGVVWCGAMGWGGAQDVRRAAAPPPPTTTHNHASVCGAR
eukprot:SAG11_NODE_13390_length_657_cov_1.675627_1_plen_58_part_01